MDYNQVKDLITRIDQSSLTEFELKLDNAYVRMGKNTSSVSQPTKLASTDVTTVQKAAEIQISETIETPITILPDEKPAVVEGNIVKSPIVGTFYESPSPDKPVFVKVGDVVKKGQILCIVEAMKVMNEIASEFDGQIAEICVKNEQMVEYGQSLFRIV